MEFWASPYTQEHWRNLLLVKAYTDMPGVFSNNPLAGLMNGPLWTIPMEAMCYAVLTGVGLLGILRWRWLASVAAVGYLLFFMGFHNLLLMSRYAPTDSRRATTEPSTPCESVTR